MDHCWTSDPKAKWVALLTVKSGFLYLHALFATIRIVSANRLKIAGFIMVAIALLFIGGAVLALDNTVAYTVYVDGEVLQVSGEFGTVQDVISAAVPNLSPRFRHIWK